ncbi:MAG: LPS export ABC transporter periplasmic protein LptC [Candidatus Omnitrophota bacterium]|nr:MAG: LPS export ABC transporter periplasmic protein LptC [Candidatus Omnitrophota bacterium]
MFFNRYLILLIVFVCSFSTKAHCGRTIKDFYLSDCTEDGVREWELKGDSAIVGNEYVDIDKMDATYFSSEDTIKVKSQKAKIDRKSMDVQLENDVCVETEGGIKLITDSLCWQRNDDLVETEDWVEVQRDTAQIKARGLYADTNFKNVCFKKDVEGVFMGEEKNDVITINCIGPLEVQYNEGKAVFYNNVEVQKEEGRLCSDKAIVFFDDEAKKIRKIVSEGNVKMVRDGDIAFGEEGSLFD